MRCAAVAVIATTVASSARAQPPQAFSARLNGELQTRYVAVHAPRGGGVDQDESGFQVRRARLAVTGSFISPQYAYRFRTAYDRATGTVQLDDAWAAWRSAGGLRIQAGQFKPAFLREEIVSGFTQLAAERSYAADYFTIDYTQGVEASVDRGPTRWFASFHDGSYGLNTDFANDRTAAGGAARLEVRTWGTDWRAFSDMSAWSGIQGMMAAVGVDIERGERNGALRMPDVLKYTADVAFKARGVSLMAAITGQRFTAPDTTGGVPSALDGARQASLVAQAAAFVAADRLELFGRYEHLDFDGAYYRNNGELIQATSRNLALSALTLVTVGANWYLARDQSKLSLDVTLAGNAVPVANTGSGLLRSDRRGQLAVRSQFQIRF